MNSRLNYSVLALAICSANTALAADTPDTVSQDTVVINAKALGYAETGSASANKSSRPVSDSPYSISVINQTQLQDTGAQTLQDALTYNAGVFASEFGVDSRADTAVIRGAGFLTIWMACVPTLVTTTGPVSKPICWTTFRY
nr:TonB-dependent receptor plug domain-containing protein [Aliamphritea spongicola]